MDPGRLKKFIMSKKDYIFLSSFLVLLFVLIGLLSKGFILLGGEGDYFLNISSVQSLYSFSWLPMSGLGGNVNPLLQFPMTIFNVFSLLEHLGLPLKAVNMVSVFLVFALPFVSMYWLLRGVLKVGFKISALISLFYILNPLSIYHLQGLMFWNTAPLFVMPVVFGLIYKYFSDRPKLFFLFGLITFVFSFAFANIPYLGIFHIFLIISLVIISYLRSERFNFKAVIKNFIVLEASFIIFNAWWLLNLLKFQLQDAGQNYTKNFAIGWVGSVSHSSIFYKLFSFTQLIDRPFGNDFFFSTYFLNGFIGLFLLIPFSLLIASLITKKFRDSRKLAIISLFLLFVLFLAKGVNEPFGQVYIWLLNKVPFFIIFKTPLEKFSVLFVFLFSVALIFVLRQQKKIYYYLFFIYLLVVSIPLVTLNFIPDYKIADNQYVSKKFVNKQEYQDTINLLNNEREDARILSLPGSLNYQVTMANHDDKYYRGMDPILYAIKKSFIAAYSSPKTEIIYKNLSNPNIKNVLAVYNIKNILINADIVPSFGFMESESTEQLAGLFSKSMKRWESGSMSIFKNYKFLPHFYTPSSIVTINQPNSKDLFNLIARSGYNLRSLIYINGQSKHLPFDPNKTDIVNPVMSEGKYVSNEIALGNEFKDRVFNYIKLINANSNFRLKTDPTKKSITISNDSMGIKVNHTNLDVIHSNLHNISLDGYSFVKIGDQYFDTKKDYDQIVRYEDLAGDIKGYNRGSTLISDSFDDGLWADKATDLTPSMAGDPDFYTRLSGDTPNRKSKQSLEIGSKNHHPAETKDFHVNIKKGKTYRLTFDYKNVTGNQVQVNAQVHGKTKSSFFGKTFDAPNHDWNTYEIFIDPKEDANNITLFFFATPSPERGEVVNRYDNIKLEELSFAKNLNNFNVGAQDFLSIYDSLKLQKDNSINLINNTENTLISDSFDDGLWADKATDLTPSMAGDPDFYTRLSGDTPNRKSKQSLEIGSKNHHPAETKDFHVNIKKGKTYRLTFDYKNVTGNQVQVNAQVHGKTKSSFFGKTFDAPNHDWNTYEIFIDPKEDANNITLFFFATPSPERGEVVNRYDNIKLEELSALPSDFMNYYLYSPAKEKIKAPEIEYKKINPTKYRIMVHGASEPFPLVFSENYNSGWKAYAINSDFSKSNLDASRYKSPDTGDADQASSSELSDYINRGLVTTLGNGKGFVSKDIQGTIQNDNLPNGNIFETLLADKSSLPEKNHFIANGYANSWWVDVNKICSDGKKCKRNADGSYDMEFVVEFWPQRLFYIGLVISGSVFVLVSGYFTYFILKRKRKPGKRASRIAGRVK